LQKPLFRAKIVNAVNAYAVEVSGVNVAPSVSVHDRTLTLNGGVRKKPADESLKKGMLGIR
jgi:hypothetical protein